MMDKCEIEQANNSNGNIGIVRSKIFLSIAKLAEMVFRYLAVLFVINSCSVRSHHNRLFLRVARFFLFVPFHCYFYVEN